jgi:hypothetical protein
VAFCRVVSAPGDAEPGSRYSAFVGRRDSFIFVDRLSNLELFSSTDERQVLAQELELEPQPLMELPPVPDESLFFDEAICSW